MYTSEELYRFAAAAYAEAKACLVADEVPVGAVVVYQNEIITTGRNRIVELHDPTAHAEMLAIRAAAAKLGNERLMGCDLFTTLEPCMMCSGALLFARIRKVYYLARELRLPALRSVLELPGHNHKIDLELLDFAQLDAAKLLRGYFEAKRGNSR